MQVMIFYWHLQYLKLYWQSHRKLANLLFHVFSGIALCSTAILYDNIPEYGIYFIIVFLDTSMNFGQGMMTCAVFGLESKYVFIPLLEWFKKIRKLYKNIRNGKQTERETQTTTTSLSLRVIEMIFRAIFESRNKRPVLVTMK